MNAELKKMVGDYAEAKAHNYATSPEHAESRLAFQCGVLLGLIDNCLSVMDEKQVELALGHVIREQKKFLAPK